MSTINTISNPSLVSELLKQSDDSGLRELQTKYLYETALALKQHFNIAEPAAIQALGLVLKMRNDYASVKEIVNFIQLLAKKKLEVMSQDEKILLFLTGFLVKKPAPFVSKLKDIGRNDLCPCQSGKKFKSCCLSMAEASELQRRKNGQ